MAPYPSPTSTWHDNTYPSISPSRPELSAKGKNVLVTGGGTGIGAETARRFAQAGASRIALLGRRKQPLFDTKTSIEHDFAGVEVFVASTDITKQSEVESAFSNFAGEKRIHVLVSNAAVTGPQESVRDVDGDKFLENIQQNLKGALYVAKAFLQHASQDAVVIDVNSFAAHLDLVAGFSSYVVAKLGVYRLWDSLAFANPGLNVFHIQPGVVVTDMNRESGGADAVGHSDDGEWKVDIPYGVCNS